MEAVVDSLAGSVGSSSHLVPRSISPSSLMDIDPDRESLSQDFYSDVICRNLNDGSSLADVCEVERQRSNSCASQTDVSSLSIEDLYVPIVGYEVMEQRARFTVFKIHVQKSPTENWFVFRRYTDFVRLNDKLKKLFPSFRLALPPKRWFGDNYDPNFLEDRQLGLQAFINNITSHKDIIQCKFTREFFCLDDQPGAHDSIEESRALCDSLEETIYNLRHDVAEKESEIRQLKKELRESQAKVHNLSTQLFGTPVPSIDSDGSWDKVTEFNNKECQTKPNTIPVYSSNISSMHKKLRNSSISIEKNKHNCTDSMNNSQGAVITT